tara:strand:+ start:4447 stop:4752 length:306 start_codon:yes stop_codon:yes gene_type:complete
MSVPLALVVDGITPDQVFDPLALEIDVTGLRMEPADMYVHTASLGSAVYHTPDESSVFERYLQVSQPLSAPAVDAKSKIRMNIYIVSQFFFRSTCKIIQVS